ncbi:secreted protein [Indibacter alkaliphilus LW1]|jgi:hypothetical protein|uniref:Secreted protein n=1 Tax=Indibacter alkaliphilus (strain CCUG 57479 / KCTC 22604 / LW1) TaxID=1189612 RepID=S2DN41_INDAL|nr:hypothetical protein [Indibacter alkaliphilus]EOZ98620.1 secreted protein [Indibacter alkaliphilus LW1]
MKKLAVLLISFLALSSCQENSSEDVLYTGSEIEYTLYQASDFDYTGLLTVRELMGGELELEIELQGEKGDDAYFFPAHLHFGAYDDVDAPMAHMLEPIDIRLLRSTTVLGRLSNQKDLSFEDFKSFDGHIKVHLADSGPEYQVIIVAGNVGSNDNSPVNFDRSKMTLCSPYF